MRSVLMAEGGFYAGKPLGEIVDRFGECLIQSDTLLRTRYATAKATTVTSSRSPSAHSMVHRRTVAA